MGREYWIKNKEHQFWQRSPLDAYGSLQTTKESIEMDSSTATGGGGRVHVPEDKSCSAPTEDLC